MGRFRPRIQNPSRTQERARQRLGLLYSDKLEWKLPTDYSRKKITPEPDKSMPSSAPHGKIPRRSRRRRNRPPPERSLLAVLRPVQFPPHARGGCRQRYRIYELCERAGRVRLRPFWLRQKIAE